MNVRPSITGMFQSTQARSGVQPPPRTSRASWPSPASSDLEPEVAEDAADDPAHRSGVVDNQGTHQRWSSLIR